MIAIAWLAMAAMIAALIFNYVLFANFWKEDVFKSKVQVFIGLLPIGMYLLLLGKLIASPFKSDKFKNLKNL